VKTCVQRSALWEWLKIGVALVLVAVVVSQTSFLELTALWRRLSLLWLFPSALLFIAIVVVTAWRSWVLIERQAPFQHMVGLIAIQTVVGNLVATSAGAASYVALLKGRHQVHIRQGIASVLLGKLGDLLVLVLALAISSAALWSQIAALHGLVVLLLAGLPGLLFGIWWLLACRLHARRAAARVMGALHIERTVIGTRLWAAIDGVAEQAPERSFGVMLRLVAYSGLLLLLSLGFGYCNTRLFGLELQLWPIVFITVFIQLVSIVPIQVFGGLGVYEVTGLYLYGLFGVDSHVLVPFLVSTRLYLYLLNLLLLPYIAVEHRLGRYDGHMSREQPWG
jgi:uncharacterized membrane protein YbhN (UPF0104 family)